MQSMLSIFEVEQPKLISGKGEPSFCDFCGEYCQDNYWKDTNHGIIHNGWCVKAMMFHMRAKLGNADEINWLVSKGIDPYRSRFEQSA
jgi:hypothetical protein